MTTHSNIEPTSTHRLRGVPELLNSLPAQFGFHLRESLVAISTRGPRQRIHLSARVDLPEAGDHCGKHETVDRLLKPLEHHGGDGVVLVALSDDPLWAEEVMHTAITSTTLPIVVAVWATLDRYWEAGYSPEEGEPYELDPAGEVVVTAVAQGRRIARDRDELVGDVAAPEGELLAEVMRVEKSLAESSDDAVVGSRKNRRRRVRRGRLLLRKLAEGKDVSIEERVLLARWTDDLAVRDVWWNDIERTNAEAMWQAWIAVARSNRGPNRCAPLALTAFAAWQAGDGARARIAAEAALHENEDYSLALLITQILDHAVHPDLWARRHDLLKVIDQ